MKNTMRFLSRVHKVLGSALGLILLIWIVSGFVLIFYKFPHAKKKAYFENSPKLDSVGFIPQGKFKSVALVTINEKPFYRLIDLDGKKRIVGAIDGKEKKSFNLNECRAIASHECKGEIIKIDTLTYFDRWIPWKRFGVHFPIYKFHFNDEKSSVLYLSSTSGEIVQHTTSTERINAWLGAIPHWFYFKWLRLQVKLWIGVILWISGIATVFILLGIVLGVMRTLEYRKKKNRSLSLTPFRKRWYKWHHLSGLFFGLVLLTWTISGFYSLTDAPQFLAKSSKLPSFLKIWYGESIELDKFRLHTLNQLLTSGSDIKKVEWKNINNKLFVHAHTKYQSPEALTNINNKLTAKHIGKTVLRKELEKTYPNSEISLNTITEYDNYYYSKSKRTFPLPVFKAVIDNDMHIYINPENGLIEKQTDPNSRAGRWLYKGLHTFNIGTLQNSNWRIVLIFVLLLGCTIMGVSGVWLFLKNTRVVRKAKF